MVKATRLQVRGCGFHDYCTVTLAVVSGTFGRALAWIVVEPVATPVTGTITLVRYAGTIAVAGTVATAGFPEIRVTVKPPAGAGADKSSSILDCLAVVIVTVGVAKLSEAVTFTVTVWLVVVTPGEAVTVAVPN